jgi:hypothetical protein
MLDAGRVRIQLRLAADRIEEVEIRSQRPQVANALRGKPAAEAVQLVPLIFALCGRAQGQAAGLALAAARGVETPPMLDAAIETEVMREHLWRLLLDLPPLLGLPAQRELFLKAQQAVASGDRPGLKAVLAQEFWNELLQRLDQLAQPAESVTTLLPVMSARTSLTAWPRLDGAFAMFPLWQGEAAETGAYARWGGQNPAAAGAFAARWHARSAELWSWAIGEQKVGVTAGNPLLGTGGTASATGNGAGVGRSLIETARGLLMHEITLDGDRIADYVIVAPTEWNFHPRGSLFDWLHGRPVVDDARLHEFIIQAIAALDPCVRWELEVIK